MHTRASRSFMCTHYLIFPIEETLSSHRFHYANIRWMIWAFYPSPKEASVGGGQKLELQPHIWNPASFHVLCVWEILAKKGVDTCSPTCMLWKLSGGYFQACPRLMRDCLSAVSISPLLVVCISCTLELSLWIIITFKKKALLYLW